jgi:hypothetical protein
LGGVGAACAVSVDAHTTTIVTVRTIGITIR